MKTLSQIYEEMKSKFFDKTKLDVEPGTVIDSYLLASSEALLEAYDELEASKNPYIFTKLAGEDLDSTGFFVNCPRIANEPDATYKYRLMNWMLRSQTGNQKAIELALMNMDYASYVTYVPYTEGIGTATAYIIPKSYELSGQANAIAETQMRLREVISPASYTSYKIPDAIPVKIAVFMTTENADISLVQENIKAKIEEYVNHIAVGEYLEIGELSKIGINETGVNYLNIVQIYINDEATSSLNILQRIESKFLFDDMIWWTAV